MNRLVIIGNGFDLAHELPTSYADFINWYWDYRCKNLPNETVHVSDDGLCKFEIRDDYTWASLFSRLGWRGKQLQANRILDWINSQDHLCSVSKSAFMENICINIEQKRWVDIENEYYKLLIHYALEKKYYNEAEKENDLISLNNQLNHLKELLAMYLLELSKKEITKIDSIYDAIYAPIDSKDVAVSKLGAMENHVEFWQKQGSEALKMRQEIFRVNPEEYNSMVDEKGNPLLLTFGDEDYPLLYRLPSRIMLLNFNYTATPLHYLNPSVTKMNYIHGNIENPVNMIFGYGDEIDERFYKLKELNNTESLRNVKSIRYLDASNYRALLSFINEEPFQVLIMGHSCGNSDRTLLNTIFEDPNCVSVKPYYYEKPDGTDDYLDKAQNISRNFTDMKLMRDRVVNKTQCEPLVR